MPRMTAGEYVLLPETTYPIDLIDGQIVGYLSPTHTHQRVVLNALIVLQKEMASGQLVISPMDVHLDEYNIIQPDLMWISGPNSLCKVGADGWLHGAPDLVCEVIAPYTINRDKITRFALYEKHGVREYWLIDPTNQWVEIFIRQEDRLLLMGVYYKTTFLSPILKVTFSTQPFFGR
jgi:Uma2 family endonuclease